MSHRLSSFPGLAAVPMAAVVLAFGLATFAGAQAGGGGLAGVESSLLAWATADARTALEKIYDAGNPEHLKAMGEILVQEGKLDEAKSKLERAAELAAGDPETRVLLGQVYARQKNREQAESAYRKAAELARQRVASKDSGPEPHLWLAVALLGQGQFDAAVEHLQHARDGRPDDPRPYYYMGLARTFQRRWPDAIEQLSKALEREGRYAYALYYRGLANSQINRKGDMLADLEKFLFLAPNAPEAETARQLVRSAKG